MIKEIQAESKDREEEEHIELLRFLNHIRSRIFNPGSEKDSSKSFCLLAGGAVSISFTAT